MLSCSCKALPTSDTAISITAAIKEGSRVGCGISSAVELSVILGNNPVAEKRTDIVRAYPSPTVSLLDVKNMCFSLGTPVSGVKASLNELLTGPSSFIAALNDPDHFTVVLDGDDKQVRIRDSEVAPIEIWPRSVFEARFTGYALVPRFKEIKDFPVLESFELDKFVTYNGNRGKIAYSFPITNTGSAPLNLSLSALSCGCTTALFDNGQTSITVPPGSATHFNMSYTVDRTGLLQQIATVESNIPFKPVIYFTLRSVLPLDVTASPKSLFVFEKLGERTLKYINVTAPSGTKLEGLQSTVAYLTPKVVEHQSDISKEDWKIEVSGVVAPTNTTSLGEIVIKTSFSTLKVPVDGKITKTMTVKGFVTEHTSRIELPDATQAALLPRAEDDEYARIGSPLPTVKVGQAAPYFAATDVNGVTWKLSELKGKNVLLTFFPKCFTGGCANHLSSLRDHQKEFDATQTQILAVSVDPAQGGRGQIAFAKEWGFTFPFIPDTSRALGKQFGAIQNDDELAARMSILIDKNGIVRWIDTDVHVQTHGADVLAKVKELGLDAT